MSGSPPSGFGFSAFRPAPGRVPHEWTLRPSKKKLPVGISASCWKVLGSSLDPTPLRVSLGECPLALHHERVRFGVGGASSTATRTKARLRGDARSRAGNANRRLSRPFRIEAGLNLMKTPSRRSLPGRRICKLSKLLHYLASAMTVTDLFAWF